VRPAPAGHVGVGNRRRASAVGRTRAVVGGTAVAAFLAILAAVGIHGRSQPASNVTANDGAATRFDPGLVRPGLGQYGQYGSSSDDPSSRGFSGGGFSATPGAGGGSAHTRSHGS